MLHMLGGTDNGKKREQKRRNKKKERERGESGRK